MARTATADTTGNWGTAANWDLDTLPATGDTVVIPTGINITLNGIYPAAGAFLSVNVQAGGTLTIPVDANSGLTLAGDSTAGFTVAGILTTAGGAAIGAAYSCLISITPATDGGSGMIITSTGTNSVTLIGATKTHFVSLAADCGEWAANGDAAPTANITSLTVDAIPTGWVDNDLLVIAPTGRTYSHWDTCLVNVAPTTTTVNVDGWQGTAPLYAAGVGTKGLWCHQGEGTPTQARAEVLNLTRNIKVFSTDITKRCYISAATTAVVTMSYIEVYSCGVTTAAKRALSVLTTTGSVTGTGSVFHDVGQGVAVTALTTGTFTPTNWIVWSSERHAWSISALTLSGAGALTVTACVGAGVTVGGNYGISIGDAGSLFPSCRATGNVSSGFFISEANVSVPDGAYDGIVAHSNGSSGVVWNNTQYTAVANDISALVSWRNVGFGVYTVIQSVLRLSSPVVFGNSLSQLLAAVGVLRVVSLTDAETNGTYQSPTLQVYGGLLEVIGGTIYGTPLFAGCGVMRVNGSTWTSFGAPTIATGQDGAYGYLLSFRHNGLADDHRIYFRYGSVLSNATTRHTASGLSWQHLPTGGAAVWFRPNIYFRVPVQSGIATTIKAWVYEDATYDGTAHPRIVALGGYLQGIASDGVGDSHTGAEAWEQLTVTVTPTETGMLPFIVEGQGTTGSFYVDDLSVTF